MKRCGTKVGIALLTSCFILFLKPASAAYNEDLAKLTRGMPREIVDFIDRRANCNHWSGEEGYDQERRMMIEDAMRQLRCSSLETEETVLKRGYSGRPEVLRALDESKDWSPG